MRKYYSKCSKYLVSEFFNKGKELYKTKIPNIFYKKEDDGIIYQYEYDKDENIINKKEWSVSQEDFLCDKWSVVNSYVELHGTLYLEIFNAYDKYCEENNIPKLEESIINQYFCYAITHEKNIIIKELDGLNQDMYNVYINTIYPEKSTELLFSFTPTTNSFIFQEILYGMFNKDKDIVDKYIMDNFEFIKFLCNYIIDKFKQN